MKNYYFLLILIIVVVLIKSVSSFSSIYTIPPNINYNLPILDSQNNPLPVPIVQPPLSQGQTRSVDIKSYVPAGNYTINYTNSPSNTVLTVSQNLSDTAYLNAFKLNAACVSEYDSTQRGYAKTSTQPASQVYAQYLCNSLGYKDIKVNNPCAGGVVYSCVKAFPITINLPTTTNVLLFNQYDASGTQVASSTLKSGTNSLNMNVGGYITVAISGTNVIYYFGNNNKNAFNWKDNTISQTNNIIGNVFTFTITLNITLKATGNYAYWRIYDPNTTKNSGTINSNQTFTQTLLLGDTLNIQVMKGTKLSSPDFSTPGTFNVSF